jgi:hypothetical protein
MCCHNSLCQVVAMRRPVSICGRLCRGFGHREALFQRRDGVLGDHTRTGRALARATERAGDEGARRKKGAGRDTNAQHRWCEGDARSSIAILVVSAARTQRVRFSGQDAEPVDGTDFVTTMCLGRSQPSPATARP